MPVVLERFDKRQVDQVDAGRTAELIHRDLDALSGRVPCAPEPLAEARKDPSSRSV